MQQTFKRIGAAIGSALMLGSSLAGAALAAGNVADFYDGIAVVDGSADDTLIVLGTGGTSPSGIAADLVSAIGIASEIGDHRMVEAAGGVGEVTLSVDATTVDGKTLEGQLGREVNDTLTQPNITFYAAGEGGNSLSTLGSKYVQNAGGTAVKNRESIAINSLGGIRFDYQANDLVTSTDGTEGYGATELEIPYANEWIVYESKFDTPIDRTTLKSQKLMFLGKEYTVLSATTTQVKVAGTGAEQTLNVGDEGIEFSDATITLDSVMTQGTGGTTDKALIKVESGGTTESKLINEGSTETVNGIEVTILSAGPSYGGDTTSGSANVLLGGNALTLKNGQAMTTGSDWKVTIGTGTDSTSTVATSVGISYIKLAYSKGHEGRSSIAEGNEVPNMDELGENFLTLEYPGMTSPTFNELDLTLGNQLNLDNQNDADTTYVLEVNYPDKVFTMANAVGGTVDVDTFYVALDAASEGLTSGNFFYTDSTNTLLNYTDSGASSLTFLVGDKQWTLKYNNNPESTTDYGILNITEPTQKYPLGTTNTGKTWMFYLWNTSGSKYTYFGTATTANANLTLYSGTTDNFSGEKVAWLDSSATLKSLTNFVSLWGTKLITAGSGQMTLGIPEAQGLPRMVVGSSSDSTETATASLGGDAVSIGGVDITVTGTASSLSLDEWPMPVAKVDSDVTAADKSGKTLVLVGGPVVNSLTAELTEKLGDIDCAITNDDPGAGKGRVAVVEDAFGDGVYAVVVAGSDRKGTTAAAQLLQVLDDFTGDLDSTCVTVEYVSAGEVPTAVAAAVVEEEEEEEEEE